MNSLIQENVPMHSYTSFKVGGPARYFAEPSSLLEIREVLQWCAQAKAPIFVVGKGTNLVVADEGYDGLILHLGKRFSGIQIQYNTLICDAGCLLNSAVKSAVDAGLAGIENLGGIPGTLGGGAFINAGALDQELCQVISKVTTLDAEGKLTERNNAECDFSYRHSGLMNYAEIIVQVELTLRPADPVILREQMNAILLKRRDKQPLDLPNAGSMFKRPPGGFAGVFIEKSGLKGFRVGDAAVSEKHANFVVNLGHATAQQIWELTKQIIAKVQADHGVTLEREVIFLGMGKV